MDLVRRYSRRFVLAAGLLSVTDLLLLGLRILLTGTHHYSFIPWNLALAWISPLLAVALVNNLRHDRWLSWRNGLLSVLWLAFLPNTWYVLTDFVHVQPTGEISQIYDIVLVGLMVFTGFLLGFAGLFIVHRELIKRFGSLKSYGFVEAVILLSSFAVYIGRDLRWNSWDVIANPGAIVSVSDQIADPFGSPRAFTVTFLFFVLISALYGSFMLFTFPSKRWR